MGYFLIGFLIGSIITMLFVSSFGKREQVAIHHPKPKEEEYNEDYWWNDGKKPDLNGD